MWKTLLAGLTAFCLFLMLTGTPVLYSQPPKIISSQLADSLHMALLHGSDVNIDTLTITDSLCINSAEAIPFIVRTASDGQRLKIDSSGNITTDGSITASSGTITGDILTCDSLSIVTTSATPVVGGTATDASRFTIDSSGNIGSDGDLTCDTVKINVMFIESTKANPWVMGTATDATRATIDSSGNMTLDADVSAVNVTASGTCEGDSTDFNVYNSTTTRATAWTMGTATDAVRASIDSTGAMGLDASVTTPLGVFDSISLDLSEEIVFDDSVWIGATAAAHFKIYDGSHTYIFGPGAYGGFLVGSTTSGNGAYIINGNATASTPHYTSVRDVNTGFYVMNQGAGAGDSAAICAGGVDGIRVLESSNDITVEIGGTAADDAIAVFKVIGDADSDGSATTGETLQLTLTPHATPTLATWGFTTTQSAGIDFDMPVTATSFIADGVITATTTLKGDSLYVTEANIITTEDTTLVIGTATDGQRAIIDSSGNAIFDGTISGTDITGSGTLKGDSLYVTEVNIITTEDSTFVVGTATDAQRAIIDSSGNAIFDGDLAFAGHVDGRVFHANAFQYPNPGTEWTPELNGAGCPASQTAKKVWLPLNFLKVGDEITTFNVVGDATETNALTLDGQIYSINKADPITTTAITNGAMTQIDAGGNFDQTVNLDDETVATDKQYVIEFTATTGVGDVITIMGVEITVNRK